MKPPEQAPERNTRGQGEPLRSELLREVNERIREVGNDSGSPASGLEFVCECGGRSCEAMVELSRDEYDGIRHGAGLVLANGHMRVVV